MSCAATMTLCYELRASKRVPPSGRSEELGVLERALGERDVLQRVLCFTAEKDYLFLAGVSRLFREAWLEACESEGIAKETSLSAVAASVPRLVWALRSGLEWSVALLQVASRSPGGVAVLNWGLAHGCFKPGACASLCYSAAGAGMLETLQWARGIGCCWDVSTCAAAAASGHLEVLKWARANGCPWDCSTCASAARGGHLEVLQWCRANGCPWDQETLRAAASCGHLAVLEWAYANGCPGDRAVAEEAAFSGQIEVFAWARAKGIPWGADVCAAAADQGHLVALQWCRANGCPWDASTCEAAMAGLEEDGPYPEVLEWIHANGCPCKHAAAAAAAVAAVAIVA